MIKKIYILGNHIQALEVSRASYRAGIHVTLFSNYNFSITRYSRSCKKFVLYNHHAHLLDLLLKNEYKSKEVLLIPTNDNMVHFLTKNYYTLKEHYSLSIASPPVIDICYNKIKTYKTAKALNIPIPESYFPVNIDELRFLNKHIAYPVIIKPAIMHAFFSQTGKKAYKCNNADELIKNYLKACAYIPSDEIIVQEFLPGGAQYLYSYGSFFANGISYAGLTANRIRQKPMDFGIATTFAITVVNKKIDDYAEKFLSGINYFGISETEFMFDPRTNEYKLLEINPRTWKWHSISTGANISFVEALIKYHNNEKIPIHKNHIENLGWIERLTDTYVAISEIIKGRLSLKEYIKTIRIKKQSACWSWSDPLPALMYIILTPYLFFKR